MLFRQVPNLVYRNKILEKRTKKFKFKLCKNYYDNNLKFPMVSLGSITKCTFLYFLSLFPYSNVHKLSNITKLEDKHFNRSPHNSAVVNLKFFKGQFNISLIFFLVQIIQ